MPRSKPFVVATEGQTIDGRNISREWIQQMAAKYDPKVYTAVANLEHLLFFSPDGPFSAQGTVVSLSTQEADILGEKKLQLMAVVDASDAVVSMQKAGKKLFASIEVAANFVGKGFAYLTGLAFTDTPASLGTESMKFSAGKDGIYSFSDEVAIEFESQSEGETLLNKIKALFNSKDKAEKDKEKTKSARFSDIEQAVEVVAGSQRDLLDRFNELSGELKAANGKIAELTAANEKDRAAFAAFKEKVESTPDGTTPRHAATGDNGKGYVKTDC
jgi:hypothetical protein